ncbi:MAG: DinB family protein [Algoriphagus sp.]|uniref:DinB family protein n=1 Tax=Algoriphagus sp. TaxID=1872435 RepID=UPI0017DF95C9|nr:DinB family protein [Algoriphagus sp.]NVJ86167.1 DinB family protein [Algoriphagus sp.]
MIESFKILFDRELDKLEQELKLFRSTKNLWRVEGEISNSAGNLAIHLIGNLRTFIAHEMGGFDYTRNRDHEFSAKNIPLEEMLNEIQLLKRQVIETFQRMDDFVLNERYPIEKFGKPMTYGYFLLHLYGHFDYHLGQINYARRLLDKA